MKGYKERPQLRIQYPYYNTQISESFENDSFFDDDADDANDADDADDPDNIFGIHDDYEFEYGLDDNSF